jgi:hypothetical protein
MKTTDPRDPLDRQIDDLLARRPLVPSADFVARTLAAANQIEEQRLSRALRVLLPFALPLAAAAALVLLLGNPVVESDSHFEPFPLETALDQEIFLLEQGLSGLAGQIEEPSPLDGSTLLQTFDALYFGLES